MEKLVWHRRDIERRKFSPVKSRRYVSGHVTADRILNCPSFSLEIQTYFWITKNFGLKDKKR